MAARPACGRRTRPRSRPGSRRSSRGGDAAPGSRAPARAEPDLPPLLEHLRRIAARGERPHRLPFLHDDGDRDAVRVDRVGDLLGRDLGDVVPRSEPESAAVMLCSRSERRRRRCSSSKSRLARAPAHTASRARAATRARSRRGFPSSRNESCTAPRMPVPARNGRATQPTSGSVCAGSRIVAEPGCASRRRAPRRLRRFGSPCTGGTPTRAGSPPAPRSRPRRTPGSP